MKYKIQFKKSVFKDLYRLPKKEAKEILNKIDTKLPEIADTLPSLKGKFRGMRRYRVGNYRVVYAIIDDSVLVLRIQHRKDVYRK